MQQTFNKLLGGFIFSVYATQNTRINEDIVLFKQPKKERKKKKNPMDHFYELLVFMLYMKV